MENKKGYAKAKKICMLEDEMLNFTNKELPPSQESTSEVVGPAPQKWRWKKTVKNQAKNKQQLTVAMVFKKKNKREEITKKYSPIMRVLENDFV